LLAVLPFVLWMVRNQVVGGAGLANRQIRFHAFRPEALRVFLFQPTTWVIPEALVLPRIVRGFLAAVAIGAGPVLLLVTSIGRTSGWRSSAGRAVLPWLLLILVPAYLAVLAFNSLFLDAATTYDGILRYLTPLFILVVLLDVTAYARIFPRGWTRWPLAVLVGAWVAVSVVTNSQESLAFARASTYATGFTRIRIERLDLAQDLRAAPVVITDNPEMVYYLADRPAYMMPIKYDQYQQAFRQDYPQQIDLAHDRLEAGAVLVIFGEPSADEAEAIDLLKVSALRTYAGAVTYGYPP
jgi:hypothetical protein